ncbi:hypothetical protein ILUMI_07594 [Ignelater luminosus]|uniref:Protein white n=1 Tax=Ignelater luminosus TaxID=2038154 RepID=A0A8K0D361_IGNLU|nr:hypothetical protein ILUMI_07594 [Ignelater luminosus]
MHNFVQNWDNKRENDKKILSIPEKITFTWSNINVTAIEKANWKKKITRNVLWQADSLDSRGKRILTNVNGVARPGELLAILGASGSGKTTLLNVLTSRQSSKLIVSGLRCANGVPADLNCLTSQMAYVQQEDLFIGTLNVQEHLIFQALVRMDKDIPYYQRMKRVKEVLMELGLDDCKDTIIGIKGRIKGISGGEMKRLSFAAEVLTNPSLMFCDEPTSGLDSFMALNVVQVLKRLAQSGKTIVCTIHQPSSGLYTIFDKLLLMAEGKVAFLGTPSEANAFFTLIEYPCPSNYNPADFFIQVLAVVPGREKSCKQTINEICDKFKNSPYETKIIQETASIRKLSYSFNCCCQSGSLSRNPYKASWSAQFRAVLWRSWISIIKDPFLIKVRLLQTVVLALIIGSIFYGQKLDGTGTMNINGALFTFLTNMTFQNAFTAVMVFCLELPTFLREHKNGMYRADVYFLCKTLAELPIFIFIPIIFVSICYYLVGLNPEPARFLIAVGIVILIANVATSYGYLISCISGNINVALSIAPPLIIPFLLFGGFFLNVKSIPVYFKWISYISWFQYGNEALMINQWKGVKNINCSGYENSTCSKNGHIVLQTFNFSEDNFYMDITALILLIFSLRLLAYFCLLLKTYKYD